jgi:hypothetical protein
MNLRTRTKKLFAFSAGHHLQYTTELLSPLHTNKLKKASAKTETVSWLPEKAVLCIAALHQFCLFSSDRLPLEAAYKIILNSYHLQFRRCEMMNMF